ncbi:mannose-6-phosphate isomerase, class I [Mangrovihabitans endophyticus]|uniref:mannose-6-phosphate isomerase n=1 Tax=Mangrovihabitans endophyticus TaxID=1751298 RepID=A0A8J3BX34_9ACTN|nr:mannose-6-phosphate isomerase, class I [Mangrovihabitans endophyticus]GGK86060.1 putative mannose-6-phosphate isomerase ManA [Mangrovihabitans endophyticus]
MSVSPLTGAIRPYAWGSRTVLATLQGRPAPTAEPEAELWLGAHPGDPSRAGGESLAELIAAEPEVHLGAPVLAEFGIRLPYLMKVLAAETPLSLQAHPDAAYAARAYAAQQADPSLPRNYTDAHHKPEMLVAITPFEALCGFRDPAVSARVLEEFGLPQLAPVVEALRTGPAGIEQAVRTLLTWPESERPGLIDAVVTSARRCCGADSASGDPAIVASARLALTLAEHYPGDPGVLVAQLLNHVRLAPGEAIWMPAGNLHAYLRGAGVEIMAASDNVLRGGLTPKRVDVGELLRVLRFTVLDDPLLPSRAVAPGVVTWPVPVREFALFRVSLDGSGTPVEVPGAGPRIVVGTAGKATVSAGGGSPVDVTPGVAAYVPDAAGALVLVGDGEVFVATVPAH